MREFTLKNICYLFFLLSLSSNGPLHASPSQSLLNSERIEQRFGDFGIEVLEADSQTRISNLYSMDSAGATMRTLAIVNFIAATDPHLAAEHRRIIAGESIGAVFQESGWHIEKVTLAVCAMQFDIDAYPQLQLMNIELPATLAFRRYVFRVSSDGSEIDYATITEIHHPDYLTIADLAPLVGLSPKCDYN